MPELPEVETIRARLEPVLSGKKILSVIEHHPKPFQGSRSDVEGMEITGVSRRAKILQFDLSNDMCLVSHLKMTGQWIYQDTAQRLGGGHPTADWIQDLPSKHSRLEFELSDGAQLFFNDQRLFGWVKVVDRKGLEDEYAGLGPDVTDAGFTVQYFASKVGARRVPVKQFIMDNAVVCGVGNIYACDSLNVAKIDPLKPISELSPEELETLYFAMRSVIEQGVELGGATMDHFRHIDGFSGEYQHHARVYGRAGEPCKNCGEQIEKIKLGGRGTFFCPRCQK